MTLDQIDNREDINQYEYSCSLQSVRPNHL